MDGSEFSELWDASGVSDVIEPGTLHPASSAPGLAGLHSVEAVISVEEVISLMSVGRGSHLN